MTLLPFTEEAEWLRFVPCWLHANLKMASRSWNKRQPQQKISCEFGYPRNILRIRLPIGDVPVGEGKIPEPD
jgi:hypothetical protein